MTKKTALMLTLGHNSSAIYFDGKELIGYEEERLNKIKSSSAYPKLAIEEILKHTDIKKGSKVFVSHWFNDYYFYEKQCKYFDTDHFQTLCKKFDLTPVYLSDDFTHHDAHAFSAIGFARYHYIKNSNEYKKRAHGKKMHTIVADGFGNNHEVVSIYESDIINEQSENWERNDISQPKLVFRHKGYCESLGLMYQYAVDYVGMKMNQDEYKFLGYESSVTKVLTDEKLSKLKKFADHVAEMQFHNMIMHENLIHHKINEPHIVNKESLKYTHTYWFNIYDALMHKCIGGSKQELHTNELRVVIGHFVQTVIESVLLKICNHFNIENVALAGGIFYNVKLNNVIMNKVKGLFSVMPLAGDQGCGLGMYEAFCGSLNYNTLKIGKRPPQKNYYQFVDDEIKNNVYYFKDVEEAKKQLTTFLSHNKIVNVVRSNMEFGPRALCSTTTFALPLKSNVEFINTMNSRNTVMPMAPVMRMKDANKYFKARNFKRVLGSDEFMILTYYYTSDNLDLVKIGGVCHKHPTLEAYSGRPQFVTANSDEFTFDVLTSLSEDHDLNPIAINTSFNSHGTPIVFDLDSVFKSFRFEYEKAKTNGVKLPFLFIVEGE